MLHPCTKTHKHTYTHMHRCLVSASLALGLSIALSLSLSLFLSPSLSLSLAVCLLSSCCSIPLSVCSGLPCFNAGLQLQPPVHIYTQAQYMCLTSCFFVWTDNSAYSRAERWGFSRLSWTACKRKQILQGFPDAAVYMPTKTVVTFLQRQVWNPTPLTSEPFARKTHITTKPWTEPLKVPLKKPPEEFKGALKQSL